jgi:hypothetical protein
VRAAPRAHTVVHIHVPKTAGSALSSFFGRCGYRVVELDITSNDFFHSIDEAEWRAEGRRTPHLFTGHIRLDHAIFRSLAEPVTVIAVLREPVERMLSHYNFTLRMSGAPWHADVVTGRMTFLENTEEVLKRYGPQYAYFDHTGEGDWRWTGTLTPQGCLDNLRARVTVFGFNDRLPELVQILAARLDLPSLALRSENVTSEIADPIGVPLKTGLTGAERAALTELLRDDIWFYEQALSAYLAVPTHTGPPGRGRT